jgi:hypothetical protein
MLRAIFASTLLVGISLNEAHAERPHTGEDLLRLCESPADQYDRDYCIGSPVAPRWLFGKVTSNSEHVLSLFLPRSLIGSL